jgi:hypothetical protein
LIIAKGGSCLIINADKHLRNGVSGKDLQNIVRQEYNNFSKIRNKLKVVIVDICNETGTSTKAFNINFAEWNTIDFYPNLDIKNLNDKYFDDYECWCLNNVLSRPLHTKDSLYWLNPVSAGVDTCIKVHNGKAIKLRQYLKLSNSKNFNITLPQDEITKLIKDGSERYLKYLDTWKLDEKIDELLKSLD